MMLLLAGGVGFVAADLANRDSGLEGTDDSKASVRNLFASAMSLVALIRSVLAMIQAAEMTASERDDEHDPQER
jgi:hypothetical protein